MPITVEDLLSDLRKTPAPVPAQGEPAAAPAQGAAPQAPQETTTSGPTRTPTTQTDEQGNVTVEGENDAQHASLLSRLGSNVGAAGAEHFGPAGAARLATGTSQAPIADALSAAAGAAALGLTAAAPFTGGATLPAAAAMALAPGVGALLEGASKTAGASDATSKLLGAAGEMLTGAGQALGGPRAIARTGRALLSGAREGVARIAQAGEAGNLGWQNVGRLLKRHTASSLERIRRPLANEIETLERGAQTIDVAPGAPGYNHAGFLVDLAEQRGVDHPAIRRIETALNDGRPVAGRDVVAIRKALDKRGGGAVNGLDPTVAVSAKDRTAVRNLATDTIREFLAPRDSQAYSVALSQYGTQYARPAAILRTLTNRDTPASVAFKAVYGGDDPTVFQTATRLANELPAFRNRMRLGFLESLNEAAGGFSQGKKALDVLRKNRPIVSGTGLFDNSELDALEMALRPGMIGRIGEAMGHLKSGRLGTALGSLGAEGPIGAAATGGAIASLFGASPEIALMTALAGGAGGAIRTLVHTPAGATANIAAARSVARALTTMAEQYNSMDPQDADFGEGSDNE